MKLNDLLIIALVGITLNFLITTQFGTSAYAATAPEAISDLVVTSGNGFAELTWTAPADNGSPITSYKLILWQTGHDVFTTYPNLSVSTTTTIVSGLQNEVSYSFKVIAINAGGVGPDSNIVSIIPSTKPTISVPEAITDLTAIREDTKVKLAWTAPFDNGALISSYKISYWESGTNSIKTKSVTSTNAQITGLANGVDYEFKVIAINSAGHSADSDIVTATPSATVSASVPGQVRGVVATPSNGQVFLTWIQPSQNGSPITSYKVIVSEVGSNVYTTFPNLSTETKTTITGLANGVNYSFKIVAINAIGSGKESTPISAIPNDKVPIEISNLRASSGDGQVTLTWSVSPSALEKISSYRIREYQYGSDSFITHPIIGKSTSATITGLKNGIPYGFSILAVSPDGIGPTSKIVYSTPLAIQTVKGAPNAITTLAATPGDGKVSLSWVTPQNNGSPITGYNIIQQMAGVSSFTTFQKPSTSTSAEMAGLTNGVTYSFKVVAVNSFGEGPDSNTVIATPTKVGQNLILPYWIKNNAKWWAEGKISDFEYAQAIQWLINEGIVKIK